MGVIRTRTVWRTYNSYGPSVRLEHCDVTDPSQHTLKPYELRKEYLDGEQVVMVGLNRLELERLRDAIARELAP